VFFPPAGDAEQAYDDDPDDREEYGHGIRVQAGYDISPGFA
jgi:hypothetical protein